MSTKKYLVEAIDNHGDLWAILVVEAKGVREAISSVEEAHAAYKRQKEEEVFSLWLENSHWHQHVRLANLPAAHIDE